MCGRVSQCSTGSHRASSKDSRSLHITTVEEQLGHVTEHTRIKREFCIPQRAKGLKQERKGLLYPILGGIIRMNRCKTYQSLRSVYRSAETYQRRRHLQKLSTMVLTWKRQGRERVELGGQGRDRWGQD